MNNLFGPDFSINPGHIIDQADDDGDMEIWRYGDMEIWRYGDMEA